MTYILKRIIIISLLFSPIWGENLKSTLKNILNQKSPLENIALEDINKERRYSTTSSKKRHRSSRVIVAIVNGNKIRKRDADSFLKEKTKGKKRDSDKLSKESRIHLLEEMIFSHLAVKKAKKELTKKEKDSLYMKLWMQKSAKKIKISQKELLNKYQELQLEQLSRNITAQIPPFELVKEQLKAKIIEEKIIKKVMKKSKIRVF